MSNIAALPNLSHKLISVACSEGRDLIGSEIKSPALNDNDNENHIIKAHKTLLTVEVLLLDTILVQKTFLTRTYK